MTQVSRCCAPVFQALINSFAYQSLSLSCFSVFRLLSIPPQLALLKTLRLHTSGRQDESRGDGSVQFRTELTELNWTAGVILEWEWRLGFEMKVEEVVCGGRLRSGDVLLLGERCALSNRMKCDCKIWCGWSCMAKHGTLQSLLGLHENVSLCRDQSVWQKPEQFSLTVENFS